VRRAILLFMGLFFLTSCGFHTRGNIILAPPLHSIYLKTNDPYGQLAKNIKQHLKTSGVHITNQPSEAMTVLDILSEQQNNQLVNTSGTQQTRQYNLILTVNFQITDPFGKILTPAQTVSESRSLTIQSNQILAGSNESLNLYQQMRRAIVFDIISRLSSRDITTTLAAEYQGK